MLVRDVEDQLREEYFRVLPEALRLASRLKTQVEYSLLPIVNTLTAHESLIVKVRVKDCVSAIDKLRRREPGGVFDPEAPDKYSLVLLRDFVGLRVLTFPPRRAAQVDELLRATFLGWHADPISDEDAGQLAFKYNGNYEGSPIPCEYQIVSTLIGLFWEIEHAAIYKQAPNIKGLAPLMQEQTSAVYQALKTFEAEFERRIEESVSGSSIKD